MLSLLAALVSGPWTRMSTPIIFLFLESVFRSHSITSLGAWTRITHNGQACSSHGVRHCPTDTKNCAHICSIFLFHSHAYIYCRRHVFKIYVSKLGCPISTHYRELKGKREQWCIGVSISRKQCMHRNNWHLILLPWAACLAWISKSANLAVACLHRLLATIKMPTLGKLRCHVDLTYTGRELALARLVLLSNLHWLATYLACTSDAPRARWWRFKPFCKTRVSSCMTWRKSCFVIGMHPLKYFTFLKSFSSFTCSIARRRSSPGKNLFTIDLKVFPVAYNLKAVFRSRKDAKCWNSLRAKSWLSMCFSDLERTRRRYSSKAAVLLIATDIEPQRIRI